MASDAQARPLSKFHAELEAELERAELELEAELGRQRRETLPVRARIFLRGIR